MNTDENSFVLKFEVLRVKARQRRDLFAKYYLNSMNHQSRRKVQKNQLCIDLQYVNTQRSTILCLSKLTYFQQFLYPIEGRGKSIMNCNFSAVQYFVFIQLSDLLFYNIYINNMGKSYILAQRAKTIRKIDFLDLRKIHFINKKKTPPLPKYSLEDLESKILSPTETQGNFYETHQMLSEASLY